MIQTYHHGRFEFFVVVIVIAIIALAAASRYFLMADDARILRMELIAHNFMTGAANTRVQFLVAAMANKSGEKSQLELEGKALYFSAQGWPVSATGPITNDYQVSTEDCFQLWTLFLQNPAPIAKGSATKTRKEYRVFKQTNNCRYTFSDGSAYFDYYPIDGKLIFIANPPKTL